MKQSVLSCCLVVLESVNLWQPPHCTRVSGFLPSCFLTCLVSCGIHPRWSIVAWGSFVWDRVFCLFLKTFGFRRWLKELDVVCLELLSPRLWKWFEGNNTWERNVHALPVQTKKCTWSFVVWGAGQLMYLKEIKRITRSRTSVCRAVVQLAVGDVLLGIQVTLNKSSCPRWKLL